MCGAMSTIKMPAAVNTMGAVTTVRSSQQEKRLCRNRSAMKMASSVMLEREPHPKNESRLTFVEIEEVSREVHVFVGESENESALNVAIGVVEAGSLCDEAETEPIQRRKGKLRPIIKEAVR